jgi:sulfate permease, SulP family
MLFASLRGYRVSWLSGDLVAGLLLAAIAIPEQIATARLAGMPPETGIIAFVAGTLMVFVFARNRFLSVGADSTIAPIFAVTVAGIAAPGSPEYVTYVGFVALLVGVMVVMAGLLRAVWVSDLLSIPVTVGFLAGISVQIVVSQLATLLGVPATQTRVVPRLMEIAHELSHVNFTDLAIGVGVLALILIAKRLSPKIPGAIIAIVTAGAAVALFHLQGRVAVVGTFHATLPRLTFPVPAAMHLGQVVPLAVVVAVVCTVQTVTTLRIFRSEKGIVDPSRDLAAAGAGSIVAAITGAFPVDASPPRTAIVQSAGAASQVTGAIAIVFVLLVLDLGSRLTSYLPEAGLAGVLLYIAMEIFRYSEIRRIARESRLEIALVVLAAAFVVLLPINIGMMLSILLSLFYGVYVMIRPPSVELVHVSGTTIWWPPGKEEKGAREPGVVVFSPAAPLYFMNVRHIVDRMNDTIANAGERIKVVVVEGSGVIDIDYTGAQVFKSAVRRLRERGIAVGLARLSEERAQGAARRTGLLAEIGEDHVFKSAEEAVDALSER